MAGFNSLRGVSWSQLANVTDGMTPEEIGQAIQDAAESADGIVASVSNLGTSAYVSWTNPNNRLRFRVYNAGSYTETTDTSLSVTLSSGSSTVYVIPVAYGEELTEEKSNVVSLTISDTVSASLAESRVGQTLAISGSDSSYSYYLMGRRYNSGGAILPITVKDITSTGYVIDDICLGLELCVVAYNRNTSEPVAYSQVFGPILHATDPVGTTVTTPAEFTAARDNASVTTIILDAGSEWSGSDISLASVDRSANPLTITTPQTNPAVFLDQSLNVTGCSGITIEGVDFYNARGFESGNSLKILNGSPADGFVLRGVKFRGDRPTDFEINDTTGYPAGTEWYGTGMDFLPSPFSFSDTKNLTISGMWVENCFQIADIPSESNVNDIRFDGIYFDGLRVVTRNGTLDDDVLSISGVIGQNAYSMYDEIDWSGGTGNAPHTDLIQIFSSNKTSGGDIYNASISDVVYTIGRTRAAADSVIGDQVCTSLIMNTEAFGITLKNFATSVRGTINTYTLGSDVSACHMSSLNLGELGGSGGFDTSGVDGEVFISDSYISGTRVGTLGADGYVISENTDYSVISSNNDVVYENTVPRTAIETLHHLRPVTDDGKGAVTSSGYLRTLSDIPDTPVLSIETATEGGFDADYGAVSGADSYRLRWRVSGGTQWTVVDSASPSFSISGVGSETDAEYQARAITSDGIPSFFSTLETVTTLALPPIPASSYTLLGSGINAVTDTGTSGNFNTREHTILASAPDVTKSHVVLFIADQLAGGGKSYGSTKAQFIDGALANLTTINDVDSAISTPGGSTIAAYAGYGYPTTDMRGGVVNFSSGSCQFASAMAMIQLDDAVDESQSVFGSEVAATNGTRSVMLTGCPQGSRVMAMAYTRTGAAVAFTSGVTEIDSQLDSLDSANGEWILGVGESQTGGTVTVTATGCWALIAVAIPVA